MTESVALEGRDAELACRDIAERRRALSGLIVHRAQVVAFALLEHRRVRHRAGGDYPYDVALYQPLCRRGVLYLLADGDLVALRYQPRDIGLAAVVRHSAHGRALIGVRDRAVARRQRKVELARGHACVLVEHLVKIAEAEKQQTVAVLRLYLLILHFHRCKLCHIFSSAFALLLYMYCGIPVFFRGARGHLRIRLLLQPGSKHRKKQICFAQHYSAPAGRETLWFLPLFRYRADAINVYVQPQCAIENALDQASFIAGLNRSGRKRMSSSHVLSA